MTDPELNLARTLARSAVNGPGERFVIWVQGCSLHCPGCWNPDTWNHRPRTLMRASELAATVLTTPEIEGVTLTGGEPFEQAPELTPLAHRVRAAGLSVMAFTGFEVCELDGPDQAGLLALCDIVVAGRYRRRLRSVDIPWRGSSNQTVHFLSDRYGPQAVAAASACEVYVEPDGALTLTGFPPARLTSESATSKLRGPQGWDQRRI